jgi:hypothetical protein
MSGYSENYDLILKDVVTDTVSDLGDTGIHLLIDSVKGTDLFSFFYEILSDIPFGGVIKGGIRSSLEFRDRQFLKRICLFIKQTETGDHSIDWSYFKSELNRNPNFKNKIVTHLINILDRCETDFKSKILGLLFTNFYTKKLISTNLYYYHILLSLLIHVHLVICMIFLNFFTLGIKIMYFMDCLLLMSII